eukprot:TRINITY_DN18883_c0_g1_i1.p1 TRINITY_DN18883_c0_g1~~TRINITY_DN18883_c0_g1_i1.p1  ORF type:complete len:171 (-),score=79.82 TRINITY_DN18883_c0_g1_i1:253-765(-)
MKIYKDIISGDELFADAYPMKLIDDVVYEVESKNITKSEGNYDIGANASEDPDAEKEDAFEATSETVNNVLDAHRLQTTSFDKKSYMTYIKGYMKAVLEKLKVSNPDRVEPFQKAAQGFIKNVLAKFDDYEFYTGESMEPEAMVILKFYKEDGLIPYFYFFKDGVEEEKV